MMWESSTVCLALACSSSFSQNYLKRLSFILLYITASFVIDCVVHFWNLYFIDLCVYFCWEILSYKDIKFCKSIFCSYWDDHVYFFFSLLMWYIILIDLWMLNHPYTPGINPPISSCMILLIYYWILFANILLRIFASMFISDIGL